VVDGDLFGCLWLSVERCFVLGGCGVAGVVGDPAVDALMVEPIDIGHRGELDIFEAPPWALPVDEFPLVKPVERLDQGIVIGVALRPDRGNNVVISEPLGVGDRQILNAEIGVVGEPGEVAAGSLPVPDRHLQRIDR